MNIIGILAIVRFEMNRFLRTIGQSLLAPTLSTSLYFIVFGSALGGRIDNISHVPYALYIVPGLVMMTALTHSLSNAGFGIFAPRLFGTIYEVLSAPISFLEMTIAYCGAATLKSLIISTVVLISASFFVDLNIMHPFWMVFFLVMTCITFCLLGYICGFWARGFEQLNIVPTLIVMPLTFLGGSFYSVSMLPPFWHTISLFNPVFYLVNGFKWSFYEVSDVSIQYSICMVLFFLILAIITLMLMHRSGRFLRS